MGELTDSLKRRSRRVKPHRMPEWWPLAQLAAGALLALGLVGSLVVRAGGSGDAAPVETTVSTQPPLVTVAPAPGSTDVTVSTAPGGSTPVDPSPSTSPTTPVSGLQPFSLLADRSVQLRDADGGTEVLPAAMWDATIAAVAAEQVRLAETVSPLTTAELRSVLGATITVAVASADGVEWSVTATQQPGGTGWVAIATRSV
jgi:hypothetical protein